MESSLFHINAHLTDPVQELEDLIDQIPRFPEVFSPGFFGLTLESADITPRILALLVQLLNQPLPIRSTNHDPKWRYVDFSKCRFASPETTALPPTEDPEQYCSSDDINVFFSLLMRQTWSLRLTTSPDILESLFRLPELGDVGLSLDQDELSALQCESLGALIERSVSLSWLRIKGECMDVEDPQILVNCLTNLIQRQERPITDSSHAGTTAGMPHQLGLAMPNGATRHGGHHIAEIRLQNTSSHLTSLCINNMDLEDCHFITLVEALPTSQLEELNVFENNIQCPGILAFAAQLPHIKCLTVVDLGGNPWEEKKEWNEQCWKALLQGLTENYSIQYLRSCELCPVEARVTFYRYLNWAGRGLLATSNIVPAGLWPFLLERAGKDNDYLEENLCDEKLRIDAIYFFLQHSPIISLICSAYSMNHRPGKKSKIMD